jgi:flavin reductase (DIM6/NTAB) family NADH-FMN oxidoreductase RutF
MARLPRKEDFPLAQVRRLLEPGPIVLVSSAHQGRTNIMTLGWHTMMAFTPALVGCVIAASNFSFGLVRASRECVINVPTTALLDEAVGIGTCSGANVDKFARFGLTPRPAAMVGASLIGECHASFECRLADDSLVDRCNFFVWEVVKAHVARRPRYPETLYDAGDGAFMSSGRIAGRRSRFRPEML